VNTLRKYDAKGFAEDIEEGERKKAIAISRNMLSKDMNLENVSSLTGLPVEEISQL
jgi:predicted transposase YdaD